MEQNEKDIVDVVKEMAEGAGGVTSTDLPSTEGTKGRVNAGAVVLTVLGIGGAIAGIVKVGKWIKKRKAKKVENDDSIEYEEVEEDSEKEQQPETEPVKKKPTKKSSSKKKVEETKEETTE